MVGVTALIVAYMAGDLMPQYFSSTVASPLLMILVCVVFAIGVGYIAYRGANTSTGVNLAVNVVQISALLVFAVIALAYRANHPDGSNGWTLDPDGNATKYQLVTFATGADGNIGKFKKHSKDFDGMDDDGTIAQYIVADDKSSPMKDKDGNFVFAKYKVEVDKDGKPVLDDSGGFKYVKDAKGAYVTDDKDGKPMIAQTYSVEATADGDPKVTADGKAWAFKKDDKGNLVPALTYKVEMVDKDNPKKDKYGNLVFAKDDKGAYIPDASKYGQNLPSDQTNPDDHATYYPVDAKDPNGVYVLDSTSGTQKAMALSDDDKKKETLETNYYLATDGDWWSFIAGKPVPTDASKDHPLGDKAQATLLPMAYQHAVLPATPTAGDTRQWFSGPTDVVKPHGLATVFIQACVAILILVGFESVTSMGEEAKNPKKHIPYAILLSLAIQGGVCYLIEYFAANFFLNPGYPLTTAAGAATASRSAT